MNGAILSVAMLLGLAVFLGLLREIYLSVTKTKRLASYPLCKNCQYCDSKDERSGFWICMRPEFQDKRRSLIDRTPLRKIIRCEESRACPSRYDQCGEEGCGFVLKHS